MQYNATEERAVSEKNNDQSIICQASVGVGKEKTLDGKRKKCRKREGATERYWCIVLPPLRANIRTGQTHTGLCVSSIKISTSIGDQHADGEGNTCKAARGVQNVRIRPFDRDPSTSSVLSPVFSSVLSPQSSVLSPLPVLWSYPFSIYSKIPLREGGMGYSFGRHTRAA